MAKKIEEQVANQGEQKTEKAKRTRKPMENVMVCADEGDGLTILAGPDAGLRNLADAEKWYAENERQEEVVVVRPLASLRKKPIEIKAKVIRG